MIKVLDKSFRILEYVSARSPFGVHPGELAEKVQLNRATCSRILRSLTEGGFLLNHGRQGGYTPGPRLLTLAELSGFSRPLLDEVDKCCSLLAEELEVTLLFSRIYSRKRYVLLLKNSKPGRVRLMASCFEDLLETATGILDLAYTSSPPERREIWEKTRNKHLILPPFDNGEKLEENFASVRREGGFCSFKEDQWIAACPVFSLGHFAGSLGLSIAREEAEKERISHCMKRLKEEAGNLSLSLSPRSGIG